MVSFGLFEFEKIDDIFIETKKHLAYAFQLCNILGSIYWDVKQKCKEKNRKNCENNYNSKVTNAKGEKHKLSEIIDKRLEGLIYYQNFPFLFYDGWLPLEFDETDARVTVRKFGLYELCSFVPLQWITLEVGTEEIRIENDEAFDEFIKFMHEIW